MRAPRSPKMQTSRACALRRTANSLNYCTPECFTLVENVAAAGWCAEAFLCVRCFYRLALRSPICLFSVCPSRARSAFCTPAEATGWRKKSTVRAHSLEPSVHPPAPFCSSVDGARNAVKCEQRTGGELCSWRFYKSPRLWRAMFCVRRRARVVQRRVRTENTTSIPPSSHFQTFHPHTHPAQTHPNYSTGTHTDHHSAATRGIRVQEYVCVYVYTTPTIYVASRWGQIIAERSAAPNSTGAENLSMFVCVCPDGRGNIS